MASTSLAQVVSSSSGGEISTPASRDAALLAYILWRLQEMKTDEKYARREKEAVRRE